MSVSNSALINKNKRLLIFFVLVFKYPLHETIHYDFYLKSNFPRFKLSDLIANHTYTIISEYLY